MPHVKILWKDVLDNLLIKNPTEVTKCHFRVTLFNE